MYHFNYSGFDVNKDSSYKDKIKSLASNIEALEISEATGVPVSELTSTAAAGSAAGRLFFFLNGWNFHNITRES